MINRLRRWFRDPSFLLALSAGLLAFAVQSGEVGSADTMHRLQTAHSFWTHQPPVFPSEYPDFGVHGRGGKLYDYYGIGQPLLLLPADMAGTFISELPFFDEYDGTDPTIRNVVVTYSTNLLVTVLTALVAFHFLRILRFSTRESVAGVLALLFCTTHLHYTQNMMENNYIMLLTLAGFTFQYKWLRGGDQRSLLIGSAALGLNLLTRLTTGLDIIGAGIFLLLVMWFEGASAAALGKRFLSYARTAIPVYAFFFFLDRLYQFHRFGTWLDTYVRYFTIEHRLQDPTLPPNYPFETPFHVGFLGPLVTPEKSIFLFDPLIVLTVLLALFGWKRFLPEVKAYVLAAFLLLLAYISFYARYTVWSGDFAWGDRYVSTAVEGVAFISVALWMRYCGPLGKLIGGLGWALLAISALVQVASLVFWLPLEIYQMETFGHPTWVIALRFKNIVAFALGKMAAWGLNTEAMTQDSWDYVHITTWNFLPFLLRRVGEAPEWAVRASFSIWVASLAGLASVLVRLRKVLGRPEFQDPAV
jgi:hypothetical protein